MGLASSSSTPLHTCPRKFLGTTAWKVVSCTWCPCWVTEIGDRPCECSWAARFSLPFYTSPIWHQKGSKCQQRPDPYEARVVLRCGCFAFPNRGLLAQYTLASTFTAREFSSQVQFPTKYSSSQQPKQGEGTALACSASVTGHLLLRESLLSQFHLPTRCAPLLQTRCLGGRRMGFPGCWFLSIWSSSGQGSLFWTFWSLQNGWESRACLDPCPVFLRAFGSLFRRPPIVSHRTEMGLALSMCDWPQGMSPSSLFHLVPQGPPVTATSLTEQICHVKDSHPLS